jgi:hypothetical protein
MNTTTLDSHSAVAGQVDRSVRPHAWTDDRCKELEELGTLMREVAAINHGSNCLERIHRCIALAEKLSRDDLFRCRDSLHNFLRGLAIADRSSGPKPTGTQQRPTRRTGAAMNKTMQPAVAGPV